jgi:hypothetical protein
MQKLVERTTIDEWWQELTPTNVAGMLNMPWQNCSIQITRVMSANMTHLTKISEVNRKWLSNTIMHRPPIFMVLTGW